MRIRSTLAVSALALALGAGFGATDALAQSDCQSRISALQTKMSTDTGTTMGDTGTTTGDTGTTTEGSTTAGGTAGTMTDAEAQAELTRAQSLCDQGQDAEANEILARIESNLAAGGVDSAAPAAGDLTTGGADATGADTNDPDAGTGDVGGANAPESGTDVEGSGDAGGSAD